MNKFADTRVLQKPAGKSLTPITLTFRARFIANGLSKPLVARSMYSLPVMLMICYSETMARRR